MKFVWRNFLLLLIILSYPFLIKYVFVQHNQFVDLPMIRRVLDKSYLLNDWVLNYNELLSPRYFYVRYIAIQNQIFPIPIIYFLNYIFTVSLITFASYFFTRKIYKSKIVSLLTTVTVLFGQSYTLGGNDLIGRDLDPSRLAFGLVIAGFTLLMYERYFLAAVLFAFSSYLHLLIGFEVPLLFYFVCITLYYMRKRSRNIVSLAKSLFVYFILSGYSIFIYISTFLAQKDNANSENLLTYILTQIRAPFHYLPSSWTIPNYLFFITFILFTLLGLHFHRKVIENHIRFLIRSIIFSIIILNFLAFVFSEIIPVYFVVALQFFRLNVLIYWLGAIIIYGGSFLFLLSRHKINSLYLFISAIPFILARPETILVPGPTHFIYLLLALAFALAGVRYIKSNFLLVFLILIIFYLPFRHYRFQINELYPFYTPEIDTAIWAKSNSKRDDVFLTPIDFYLFKLNSQRSTIVDLEDMPFHPRGMVEWLNRLKDVSGTNNLPFESITRQKIIESYANIDIERIEYLLNKYRFDYIILERNIELPYTVIYSNARYNIYHLKNANKVFNFNHFLIGANFFRIAQQ